MHARENGYDFSRPRNFFGDHAFILWPLFTMNDPLAYTPTAKKARVEIIPLIDVVFFLLATFVLFTLSLQKFGVFDLPLPASDYSVEKLDTTVYVETSGDGTYRLKQGRLSTYETLFAEEHSTRIASLTANGAKPRVMLIGAGNVSYGSMVKTLDELRRLGIEQLSIETAPNG